MPADLQREHVVSRLEGEERPYESLDVRHARHAQLCCSSFLSAVRYSCHWPMSVQDCALTGYTPTLPPVALTRASSSGKSVFVSGGIRSITPARSRYIPVLARKANSGFSPSSTPKGTETCCIEPTTVTSLPRWRWKL